MEQTTRPIPRPIGGYRALGDVTRARDGASNGTCWHFNAEDGSRAEVAILAADLVRVRLLPPGHEQPSHSWYVARGDDAWPATAVEVAEHEGADEHGGLTLTTSACAIIIGTSPFRVALAWPDGQRFAEDDPALGMGREGAALRCTKRLSADEHVFGGGERTDPFDRRGRALTFWNIDPPYEHGDATRAMYATIPFWLCVRGGRAYGILLDSAWRGNLDAGATHPERLTFGVAGGDLTYYIFGGPTPAAVLARYADLTGHMPLPPRWALGYQQSRWSYYPDAYVRDIAREFRARAIPCDALYLDIDYLDGYRDFTWDAQRFPDPAGLLRELAADGFKVVPIIDPGIKRDPTDPTFTQGLAANAFCARPDGSLFTGHVWPGECVFPDFSQASVRTWWGERHRDLLATGVAGIWNDMNEPALTAFFTQGEEVAHGTTIDAEVVHAAGGEDGPALPHAAFHNAYGLQMTRATFEGLSQLRPGQRPFVLTRSGSAGIQRYAALWTGDNSSTWAHLRLALRMCLGLGMSGVPLVGADIGGFRGDCTGELLVRFTQLGAVLPFFRNHSIRRSHPQEPWAFGQPYEAFCRQAIELRYRLLPYLYTALQQSARHGGPIARPLAYAFPEDGAGATLDDEFLLGHALLAAPMLDEDRPGRSVYFPVGTWVDLLSGERHTGPLRVAVAAPLDVLPLFAREGCILPLGPVMQYVDERPADPLTLACYLGGAGSRAAGTLYEDDGRTTDYQRGATRVTRFAASHQVERVELRAIAPEGAYDPGPRVWIAELHLPNPMPGQPVRVGGVKLGEVALPPDPRTREPEPVALSGEEDAGWSVLARRYETVVRVVLGQVVAPFDVMIEVDGEA